MREAVSLGNTNNAQAPEFIGASDRAHLGDLAQRPAPSCVTATLHLGVLTAQLGGAAAVGQSGEAGAHTLVHTSGAVCAGDVSSWTGADVATSSVGALSSVAHTWNGAAFVDIFTFVTGFTLTMASGTFTFVGSNSVDAVASGAQTRYRLALIHILAGSGPDVGDETSSARMWLSRALLTGVAPGSANGRTAQRLGADDSTELALAHLVVHLGEARPRPVVSLALRASETINTGTSVGSNATPAVLAAVLTHGLSAVAAGVSFGTGAGILCTAASIHTPDVTGLNSGSSSTAGRELSIGTGTHVRSGAEAIATRVPANRDDTLVPSRQSLPAWTTV